MAEAQPHPIPPFPVPGWEMPVLHLFLEKFPSRLGRASYKPALPTHRFTSFSQVITQWEQATSPQL